MSKEKGSSGCPTFQQQGSTFNSVFVGADNGILFKVDLVTDDGGACGSNPSGCVGGMYLDGDRDNSSSADRRVRGNAIETHDFSSHLTNEVGKLQNNNFV